ncbi:hypothetical protein JCM3775_002469 [Rhodotorula graminis]
MLPEPLQLAAVLNDSSTRDAALAALAPEADQSDDQAHKAHKQALFAVAPMLSLPALLVVRRGQAGDTEPIDVSSTIDAQRDWVVSNECPPAMRDGYLVRVLGETGGEGPQQQEGAGGGEWARVWAGMQGVASDMASQVDKGIILKADGGRKPVEVTCKTADEFKSALSKATGGVLDKLDWSNVVLGGGAVLSILTGQQESQSYKGSDLDLFLVGLEPQELIPKIKSMIDQIKDALPPAPKKTKHVYGKDYRSTEVPVASDEEEGWAMDHAFDWSEQHKGELLVIKGFNAFTLVPPMTVTGRRPVQIILQSHKTVFDALAGFDLDCCSVGWNGHEVVAVPRAVRALALGANLLDVKLARKGDSTSSIVSSRSLKYLTRGISLALPAAAQSILVAEGLDLEKLLKAGRDKAASETERKKVKTDDLSGLAGTLRREWNGNNGIGGGRDVAPFGADYGPANSSWHKLVSSFEMAVWENGWISHEFWEHAVKTMAPAVSELLVADKKDLVKLTPSYLDVTASYVVPYVASFDPDFVLDLDEPKKNLFKLSWNDIQNLQYIVKLPRSVLALIDDAEIKLKEIIADAKAADDSGSPGKKVKGDEEPSAATDVSPEALKAIQSALDTVKNVSETDQPRQKPSVPNTSSQRLDPLVTDSFPGPYEPSPRHAPRKPKAPSSNMSKSIVNPLVDHAGLEIKTKSTSDLVYRVAVLGGLWQFHGLDTVIDRALQVIWQAWVATARAATSLPQERNEGMQFLLEPDEWAVYKAKFAAQPSAASVLAKLSRDLSRLARNMAKSIEAEQGSGQKQALGEWDKERKRYLLQWVADEEMI